MNLTLLLVFFAFFSTPTSSAPDKKKKDRKKPAQKCECGRSYASQLETRIINGHETAPHMYPWMVYLTYNGEHFCGGAVINDNYILTAAHCTADLQPHEIQAVVGAHNITKNDGKILTVQSIITHPHLKAYETHDDNDIALLKLKTKIRFNKKIVPICFPSNKKDALVGRFGIISGWGSIGNNNTSDVLLESTVKILSDNECKRNKIFGKHYRKTENMCAYTFGTDTCQGDSGSPMIIERNDSKYVLAGIVSWGYGCAEPDVPGVYARATKYTDWIKRTAKGNYCD